MNAKLKRNAIAIFVMSIAIVVGIPLAILSILSYWIHTVSRLANEGLERIRAKLRKDLMAALEEANKL